MLSRILGLVREVVFAAHFGTSRQYDTYVLAFGIPDTIFLLVIGGVVGSAFIPVFTGLLSKDKEIEAWRLASTLINGSIILLAASGILLGFLAPELVSLVIAPGIKDPAEKATLVDLTRILLLSPMFLGLGGWAQGILNARHSFTLPALAPVAYNLAIILGTLVLSPVLGIYGPVWGVVVGAMLHFGLQVPGLARIGMRYMPFHIGLRDEGVATVARLMGPRVFGQAAFQTNIVAMKAIASFLSAGRISAFNYAYVLMMLPHGVFAMSLATVSFPTMAAQFAENNLEGLRQTLSRATRVLIFLTIPSSVGLLLLRQEIVATLFQFGAFNSTSTELVSSTLAYFALGLVAYAVVEILTRAFYALHDTATPVGVSVVTVLLNLGVSLVLTRIFNWTQEGLALSLALTTTLEMVLLWTLLGRKLPGWGLRSDSMPASTSKSLLSAAAMGVVLWLVMPLLHTFLGGDSPTKLQSIVLAAAGIAVGGLTYLAAAMALRSEEVNMALSLVLRRLGRARRD